MSIKSFIRNYIWRTKEPWVELGYDGKQLKVKQYNDAFTKEQRMKLGSVCDGKTDDEVADLFAAREVVEMEDPKLEVIHSGIEEDGRIKVHLDWNSAFIKHLHQNGIIGDDDDDTIANYLKLLTTNELEGETEDFYTKAQIDGAFSEIERELESEFKEASKQTRRKKSRRIVK